MKGLIFYVIFSLSFLNAQTTVGLLSYDEYVSDGYTLYGKQGGNDFYLINNCGEVVNKWEGDRRIGVGYILENGNLLKSGQNHLELRDWDNNLLWHVNLLDFNLSQHHDIEPLPNGNLLILSKDKYTSAEAEAQGRDLSILSASDLISEKIIEVAPVGLNSLSVIWEWRLWDHLIQDYDNTKPNYGVIADHPELLDLNVGSISTTDWIHGNAIDYNSDLDQIVVSARHTNEIYIIDHSTTIIEAATHAGGNSGKGGDILWRWGNPINYGQGTLGDQKFFGQHDPKWVPAGFIDAGKISVFNNGFNRVPEYSSVHLIDTNVNVNGDYSISGSFLPVDFFWSWSGAVLGETVFSASRSGANVQPNGNVQFCEAVPGRFSEIQRNGTLVWSYENPIGTSSVYSQGTNISDGNNAVFRAEKYPNDFIGFIGKDLTPTGILENENAISDNCISLILSMNDYVSEETVLYPNPFNQEISIGNLKSQDIASVCLYNLIGMKIYGTNSLYTNTIYLPSEIPNGMYLIKIISKTGRVYQKKIVKSSS